MSEASWEIFSLYLLYILYIIFIFILIFYAIVFFFLSIYYSIFINIDPRVSNKIQALTYIYEFFYI